MIFDRDILLKTLEAECLSDVGSSAVIIGGSKVGKSHLLKNIFTKIEKSPSALYCRLDMDLLKASAPKGELSDHVFLREFLKEILDQIDISVAAQKSDVDGWVKALDAAQKRAEALKEDLADPAVNKVYMRQLDLISGCKQKIEEHEQLSKAGEVLRALTADGRTIRVDELAEVLVTLRSLRKRVVLMIDDYDRLVRERGFTDQLFAFLRGANNEKKIITLVSAATRLMDVVADGQSVVDRKSLFNHFQTQRLIPFRENEPFDFLDWLGQQGTGGIALTDDERRYLQNLGGGCPHLLLLSRTRFIQQGRPKEAAARRRFEKEQLQDEFQAVFDSIWSSCDDEEKGILRDIAAGKVVAPGSAERLEMEGYLVEAGDRLVCFSSLLPDFIKQKTKVRLPVIGHASPPAPPTVPSRPDVDCSVSIPYDVFPSAMMFATPASATVVTFTIVNRTPRPQTLRLRCQLLPQSQLRERVSAFGPGEHRVEMQVDLKEEARQQANVTWTSVQWAVHLDPGATERELLQDSKRVILLPRNNFLFARFDPLSGTLADFSWLIAAWVNKNDASLGPIQDAALEIYPRLGYPVQKGESAMAVGRPKAEALYTALTQKLKLKYFDNATAFHSNENDYMQRVMILSETIKAESANCLDGAVLMASLFGRCGLDPAIVLIPGHALVGWRIPGSEPVQWEFLDTTSIGRKEYAGAMADAAAALANAGAPLSAPGSIIEKSDAFAILVDIHRTIAERRIVPI